MADSTTSSSNMKAIILSFPLNPRKITDKLLADIEAINFVDANAAYGSNMKRVKNTSTYVKLYLPNFGDGSFATSFSVSGDMDEERLTRLVSVYGLAASLKSFDFVHYLANTHLMVCISVSTVEHANYAESIQMLNDLRKFLQVQDPIKKRK